MYQISINQETKQTNNIRGCASIIRQVFSLLVYICILIFLSFLPTSFPEPFLRLHRYHHYQFVVYLF